MRVLEAGADGGRRYLVLEYLSGPTIDQRIREGGPVPVADVLKAGAALARALDAVHAQGALHRDVKPTNILLDAVRGPVLVDFGIAVSLEDSASLTASGFMVGTPAYLAPEIIAGGEAEPGTDVYALVLVMHHMLLGRATFARAKMFETLEAQVYDSPEALPHAPVALAELLTACLAKDPGSRPVRTARQMAERLDAFLAR